MSIKRNTLVSAITYAYNKTDYETYKELLEILYKLLDQENINNVFISEFTTYDNISESTQKLLSTNKG